MKLCITAHSKNLHSDVDQIFEISKYYIIYDTDSLKFEFIKNKDNDIYSCDHIIDFLSLRGIKTILTGHIGPNVYQDMLASGFNVIINIDGKINQIINKLNERSLL